MSISELGLAKAINESGYPLQLGLKQLAQSQPDWRVILTEHPWLDPLGDHEKFLDIVVAGRRDGPQRLVIECKRARNTEWFFLREQTGHEPRDGRLPVRARALVRRHDGGTIDQWLDVPFYPGSPEASYCVIRTNSHRNQELLEKTAAEVVRGVDALAQQEDLIHANSRRNPSGFDKSLARVYVPTIVTTAKIFICDADYNQIDPQTGEVPSPSAREVPFLRFTKSFGSLDAARSNADSITAFAGQSERTVIVIQAAQFPEFLSKWDASFHMPNVLKEALFAG
jgi:hypothetical protein